MKNSSLGLIAVLAVIAVAAYFWINPMMSEPAPEAAAPAASEDTDTKPVAATPKPAPAATPAPATLLTAAEQHVNFDRRNDSQYANPSTGGDWLLISSEADVPGSELAGWSVKSAISGKQFFLKDVSKFTIGPSEWAIVVHTAKDPYYTDRAREGEIHMYYTEEDMAWGEEHDTIQLVSASGKVVDTITY